MIWSAYVLVWTTMLVVPTPNTGDWTVEDLGIDLKFLIGKSTLPRIEIRHDPARLRPSDVPILRGSREKIETEVGWRGTIPLEQTLTDLLEYWRQRIAARPR